MKYSLAVTILAGVFGLALTTSSNAATESFLLNVGPTSAWTDTWGKVTLTENGATEVDVHVDLYGGTKFVDTGGSDLRPVDPHTAFVFNLANNAGAVITITNPTTGFWIDPYVPDNQTPFGIFSNGLSCCGNGASNAVPGPLDFKVTNTSGISLASFAANSTGPGYWFSADVISGFTGLTGNVAAVVPTSPIPEPESYAMLLAGLGLLGFIAGRRKRKEVA